MPKRVVVAALASFVFGVGMLLHTLFLSDGWRQRQRARSDLAALSAQNEASEVRVKELRADIGALRTRPEVQERAIRHELGFTKPGEIVLELDSGSR